MNNPLSSIFGMPNQNGAFNTLLALKQFFTFGNPQQAVQACLSNGSISQQQAELLTNAIHNGNAEEIVRSFIANGQMTQDQFNTLSSMAQQFQGYIK